jgi:hypothetical protein
MAPVPPVLAPGKRALHLAHAGQAEHVCVHLLLKARDTALMVVHLVMAFPLAIQALIVQVAIFALLQLVVRSMFVWVQLSVGVAMEKT